MIKDRIRTDRQTIGYIPTFLKIRILNSGEIYNQKTIFLAKKFIYNTYKCSLESFLRCFIYACCENEKIIKDITHENEVIFINYSRDNKLEYFYQIKINKAYFLGAKKFSMSCYEKTLEHLIRFLIFQSSVGNKIIEKNIVEKMSSYYTDILIWD